MFKEMFMKREQSIKFNWNNSEDKLGHGDPSNFSHSAPLKSYSWNLNSLTRSFTGQQFKTF